MTEVRTRVLVSAILIPLALYAFYYGGIPLIILFGIVASLGSIEYVAMLRKAGFSIPYYWSALSLALFLAMVFSHRYDIPLLWLLVFITFVEALLSWNPEKSVPRIFATLFGLLYTSIFPAMITRIGLSNPDKNILLALILMIWIVDTSAYFIGMKFGKKRNITAVSPRKSLAGFVAGGLAPWFIVVILWISKVNIMPMKHVVLVAIAAGFIGQIGDLAESMLKRFCGVKDSSNLIPGHGGILDRADSILLAGSFLYCALIFLQKVR
ncbi:MAG: phosphatidate cytidylyltransferase [Candidatus Cloacimonetes bacterium]|nr:phosphatidate cytidylyltransferase [Candidatus Cloacimonadota bacterium]